MTSTSGSTQERHPWRATVRTGLQMLVGFAAMLPAIVGAAGLDEAAPPVLAALTISGAVTRVMALPQVETFLRQFAPWLAAEKEAPVLDGSGRPTVYQREDGRSPVELLVVALLVVLLIWAVVHLVGPTVC